MADNWHAGNANTDSGDRRGWLIGHFIEDPDDIRATKEVEVTWGVHPAGEERAGWTTDDYRTTVVILVRGRFRISLPSDRFSTCPSRHRPWHLSAPVVGTFGTG